MRQRWVAAKHFDAGASMGYKHGVPGGLGYADASWAREAGNMIKLRVNGKEVALEGVDPATGGDGWGSGPAAGGRACGNDASFRSLTW